MGTKGQACLILQALRAEGEPRTSTPRLGGERQWLPPVPERDGEGGLNRRRRNSEGFFKKIFVNCGDTWHTMSACVAYLGLQMEHLIKFRDPDG